MGKCTPGGLKLMLSFVSTADDGQQWEYKYSRLVPDVARNSLKIAFATKENGKFLKSRSSTVNNLMITQSNESYF